MKRNLILLAILLFLLAALWFIYAKINVFPMADFLEYWASGKINISGGNPYDVAQVLSLERAVGWSEDIALMMLNPPWTLSYAMFFGLFSYTFSRYLCFILQVSIIVLCSVLLWKIYNGNKKSEWISVVILLSFGPILHALRSGQVTILVLLGSVGFLYFISKKSDFWAGAMASLVLYKPQLLYLFVLALVIWSLSRQRYLVLVGLAVALTASLGLSLLVNPHLISQYIHMLNFYPLENWMTATLGAFLRLSIDPYSYYIQFIPSIIGFIWFVIYWQRSRKSFEWQVNMPVIILVSILVSPYGWTLDFSVLALCVVQVAVLFDFRHWNIKKILIILTYWPANILLITFSARQNWFWWYPSFLLLWYLFSIKYLSNVNTSPAAKSLAMTSNSYKN